MREQPRIRLMPQTQHQAIHRQQQSPEQQRPFLPGPQHSKLVREGQRAVAMTKDVIDGKVVPERGRDQNDRGQGYEKENDNSRTPRCFPNSFRQRVTAEQRQTARQKTVHCQQQRQKQAPAAKMHRVGREKRGPNAVCAGGALPHHQRRGHAAKLDRESHLDTFIVSKHPF